MAIVGQGSFLQGATATNQIIQVPSNLDSLEVFNFTQSASGGATTNAVYSVWQRPNVSGVAVAGSTGTQGIIYKVTANAMSVDVTAANAFVLYDPSVNSIGSAVAITSTSNVVRPIVATGSTTGLVSGSIVRLYGVTGAMDLSGYDFTIDTVVANTSFRIAGALQQAPGAAGTAGFYRVIQQSGFYPKRRFIINAAATANSIVFTTSIPSGYTVGQAIRVIIPQAQDSTGAYIWGMYEANNLIGTVTAVNDAVATQTVTLQMPSSSFSSFTFPTAATAAANNYSKAMLIPVGEDSAYAIAQSQNLLADATVNANYLGMSLAAGALLPAGIASDVVFWRAIKADFGGL